MGFFFWVNFRRNRLSNEEYNAPKEMGFVKIRMILLGLLFALFFQQFVYAEEFGTIKIGVNLELTGKGRSYGIASLE